MKYQIVFTSEFEADIEAKIIWLQDQHVSQNTIDDWFGRLYERLWGVAEMPRLYPVDEQYTADVGRVSRKLIFREHLAVYQVDEEQRRIEFVAFHHAAARS
ncbi:MAG: type II toxin-antitoxin system RelE/ParE family toxin [Planctomycetota bacterium]